MIELKDDRIINIKQDSYYEDTYYTGCTTCGDIPGHGTSKVIFELESGEELLIEKDKEYNSDDIDMGRMTVFIINNIDSFLDIDADDFEFLLSILFAGEYYGSHTYDHWSDKFTRLFGKLKYTGNVGSLEDYIKFIKGALSWQNIYTQ